MTSLPGPFRLSTGFRIAGAVASAWLVVAGTVPVFAILASGGAAGSAGHWLVWLALVLAQGWWLNFRMPHTIEVSEAGLRFVAPTRVLVVPWSGLRSITTPLYDLGRHTMVWCWEGGRLHTWRRYEGWERLLEVVAERAPAANVRV